MGCRFSTQIVVLAFLASTGVANAQLPAGDGASRNVAPAPASGPPPAIDPAAPAERIPPVNRDEATDTTNETKAPETAAGVKVIPADDSVQRDSGDVRATDSDDERKRK
jgi:hypothetical protein